MKVSDITQKNTKERILEAAFSFFSEPFYKDFSLSELAAKVGITKTAIYRHFKNKDAVVAAMRSHFFDLLSVRLREFQNARLSSDEELIKVPFVETILFFTQNPQFINYFMSQFSIDANFDETIRAEMLSRGIESDNFTDRYGKKNFEKSFFGGFTILFFIKARTRILAAQNCQNFDSDEKFAQHLVNFILKGFRGTTELGEILYPVEITDERRQKLDRISILSKDVFLEENRVFDALATVIDKYSFCGVTIERIADELGMAKSSLYFYFENKNQLIKKLIEKEFAVLATVLWENTAEARNYSEFVYISLVTCISYYIARPSIVPVSGWLLQNVTEDPFKGCFDVNNIWEKQMEHPLVHPEFGFPIVPELITFWCTTFPAALSSYGKKHQMTAEEVMESIKKIFVYIQQGIQ